MTHRLGWQKHPTTYTCHFHPAGRFMGLSACEQVWQDDRLPMEKDPPSKLVCPGCVQGMRNIAALIDARKNQPIPDLTEGLV